MELISKNYEIVSASTASISEDCESCSPRVSCNDHHHNNVYHADVGNTHTYFLPAYLVVVVKKLDSFSFAGGSCNISMTVILHVKIENLPKEVAKQVLNIQMRLNDTEILNFDEENCDIKETSGLIVFTLRTRNEIIFNPNLRNFPFDLQQLVLKFELTSKTFKLDNPLGGSSDDLSHSIGSNASSSSKSGRGERKESSHQLRFNFHYNEEYDVMLRFKRSNGAEEDEVDNIPDLSIAYGLVEPPVTVPEEKAGIVYFPSITAKIPLFREPEYVLLSSCIPLLLLNIISVCIFSVEDFSDRLQMITTILLALFAFLPTFRQQAPIPTITSLDIAIFGSIIIMLLAVADSIVAGSGNDTYVLFVVSIAIVVVMSSYMLCKYLWYVRHKKVIGKFKGTHKKSAADKFDFPSWRSCGIRLPNNAAKIEYPL